MTFHKFIIGDVIAALRTLPDKSIHCVCTSPPYYGLRQYGTPPVLFGGDPDCTHDFQEVHPPGYRKSDTKPGLMQHEGNKHREGLTSHTCKKCGAWKGELGLEPTPTMYVQHLVKIFQEVKRVLRDDGIVWLNLGDSYVGSGINNGKVNPGLSKAAARGDVIAKSRPNTTVEGLKPKDLIMIPARAAIALQEDGWWLRSQIPWIKRNTMPESCADRPSSAVEYIYLLTKSKNYYYDLDAIREPLSIAGRNRRNSDWFFESFRGLYTENEETLAMIVNTQPTPEAHFATFPKKLVEPCIKAGTSEKGCCPECGASWERVVERSSNWHPSCACGREDFSPCTVLDPFIGSGTTALVARELNRSSIGIELNPENIKIIKNRLQIDQQLDTGDIIYQFERPPGVSDVKA